MREYLAPVLAAVGLVGFAAVFAVERGSFREAVIGWARHDLAERTELAAETLAEPLRTSDFRKLHAFGADCAADGVRLTVFTAPGGIAFDSERAPADGDGMIFARRACGEYEVRLGIPRSRVLAPFHRAGIGVVLAMLTSAAGVLLVFFVTYRQRIRIAELARLERFRKDFIADVSHELRTPLTGILGAADLLADGYDPKLVGMIGREAKRLGALAEGILSLARLDRADNSLQLERTDANRLVRDSLDALRPALDAAGIRLVAAISDTPLEIVVDPIAIGKVVSNLVLNAIRHAGTPDLAVSAGTVAGRYEVAVEDHGRGIPAEHAPRVFERFYRVDPSRDSGSGGAGLGLAIARTVARLHGGDLTLEAAKPHGCRFVLSIPLRSGRSVR